MIGCEGEKKLRRKKKVFEEKRKSERSVWFLKEEKKSEVFLC